MKLTFTIISIVLTGAVTSDMRNSTTSPKNLPTTSSTCTPCPLFSSAAPSTSHEPTLPFLGIIRVRADRNSCGGKVELEVSDSPRHPLCYGSAQKIPKDLLCAQLGCGTFRTWMNTQIIENGYHILDGGLLNATSCGTLKIHCNARPPSRELVAYKVMTWLLCIVFITLLFIRFSPRKCGFLRSKLFDQRERQWVGPTQSQSVSFYRTQAGAYSNSNTSKRHSYPMLDRLAVRGDRDNSINRNSDCDSYN